MNRNQYLQARQQGYDIIRRSLGTPHKLKPSWQESVAAFDLHVRAVQVLNRLEEKMGIKGPHRDKIFAAFIAQHEVEVL